MFTPGNHVIGRQVWQADSQIYQLAVLQFLGYSFGNDLFG